MISNKNYKNILNMKVNSANHLFGFNKFDSIKISPFSNDLFSKHFGYKRNFNMKNLNNFGISSTLKKDDINFYSTSNKLLKVNKYNFSSYNQNQNNDKNNGNENPEKQDFSKEEKKNTDDEIDSGARRMFYVFTTVSVIMVCVYYGVSLMTEGQKIEQIKRSGKVVYVGKAKIGGAWKLIDTDGKPFGSRNLEGKYYLIYFGFTKCPDVCPMSMNKIAQTLKYLKGKGLNNNFEIEAIFVSCDPDRDNLEKIKSYCEVFSKDIIGVTAASNNDEALTKMLKDFKIHASKIYLSKEDKIKEEESLAKLIGTNNYNQLENISTRKNDKDQINNYSLDHTIVTYLMGPKNQFVTYLGGNLSYKEMSDICFEEILNDLDTRRTL